MIPGDRGDHYENHRTRECRQNIEEMMLMLHKPPTIEIVESAINDIHRWMNDSVQTDFNFISLELENWMVPFAIKNDGLNLRELQERFQVQISLDRIEPCLNIYGETAYSGYNAMKEIEKKIYEYRSKICSKDGTSASAHISDVINV